MDGFRPCGIAETILSCTVSKVQREVVTEKCGGTCQYSSAVGAARICEVVTEKCGGTC